MKKSELRKIIRESIKELMNEQAPSNARSHNVHTCVGSGGATGLIRNLTVDGQVPVIGQYFNCADLGSAGGILSNNPANVAVGNFCQVGAEKPQYLVGGQRDVTSLGSGGCPTNTGTSGCNQSAWSNYNNWSTNWVNLGPFNSSNPNQPCNFICNKIQQWNNTLTNAGPVQANQLNCKLDVAQQQEQIHNCNC